MIWGVRAERAKLLIVRINNPYIIRNILCTLEKPRRRRAQLVHSYLTGEIGFTVKEK